MLALYKLPASNFEALFGTPPTLTPKDDVQIVGQTQSCDAFLVLSRTAYPELIVQAGIDPAFDFTYCQAWGLTITDDVLRRVKKELRTRDLEKITVTVSSGKVFDGTPSALANLTQAYTIGAANSITSTLWTLADNSRVSVTLAEIAEAMTLAGLAQNAIWEI